MHAVVVTEFGPPEVLTWTSVPDPAVGPGHALVRTEVADVLWLETMVRAGRGRDHFPNRPPYVSGTGVVGTVEAVGPDTDDALVGRRVVARTGSQDGDAELVAVDTSTLVPVPDGVTSADAAAAMHDAVTALALFDATAVGPDDAVLIVGASGGLGLTSVQLARARTGRTVALARDERRIARIRDLGVPVVDSEADDWDEQVVEVLGRAPSVVLDNVGGALGERAARLTADAGRFSGHGMPGGHFVTPDPADAAHRGVTATSLSAVQLSPDEVRRRTVEALEAVRDGRIRPVVGQTFVLPDAAAAHRAIERRTAFGKTLLTA